MMTRPERPGSAPFHIQDISQARLSYPLMPTNIVMENSGAADGHVNGPSTTTPLTTQAARSALATCPKSLSGSWTALTQVPCMN